MCAKYEQRNINALLQLKMVMLICNSTSRLILSNVLATTFYSIILCNLELLYILIKCNFYDLQRHAHTAREVGHVVL